MRVGVCSWSLRPQTPVELVRELDATGIDGVQLALDPLRRGDWDASETKAVLERAGVRVLSGMMGMRGEDYSSLESIRRTGGLRPDEHWETNLAAARANARVAHALGIELVSFHAGFLPERADDPERRVLLERLRAVADAFGERGVAVALETGQESAEGLDGFLRELDGGGVGVNFDPANVILYDQGDPIDALRTLAPFVRQLHVKDAVRTRTPGTWGEEVPVGRGDVDWTALFRVLHDHALDVDLVIEREAGPDRIADVRTAHELVRRELAALGGAAS